ncbi:oligosaccharide flippase family protein [Vibrio mimicus]|uniref:lipopolysaccharide biosynthesis protein n=1 Tax=Vibrio mimicus TaxID=674 RepID=UPI0011D5A321|nr:oligosaccharide flippase family protein [Vibrio mimicus]TXY29273.1 oligosaccharide flippase family protein [Vibrio mimicus]
MSNPRPAMPSALSHFALYGISLLLIKGISLIMLPVIARYLSVEQLGRLELLATCGALLGIISTASMHESLYRFTANLTSEEQRQHQASHLATLSLLFSMLVCGLGLGLLKLFPDLLNAIPLSRFELTLLLLALLFEGPVSLHLTWLRMQEKAKLFLLISVGSSALQITLILFVLMTQPSVWGVLAAGTFTRVCQFVALTLINRFRLVYPARASQLLRYSLPLMLSAMVAYGLNGAERWFISSTTALETLGYYAIAAKFALAMCLLVQPFGMWWMPKRFAMLEQQGGDAVARYTRIGMAYVLLLSLCMAFWGQWFIAFALPATYLPAQKILLIILLSAACKEWAELLNIGVLYQKRSALLFKINLFSALLAIVLCGLFSQWGVMGIASAITSAQCLRLLAISYFSQRIQPIPLQLLRFIPQLAFMLASFGLAMQINSLIGLVFWGTLLPILGLLLSCKLGWVSFPFPMKQWGIDWVQSHLSRRTRKAA